MIDLDKLSPAPWVPFSKGFDAGWFMRGIVSGERVVLSSCHNAFGSKHPSEDDEAFIIVARQAFDVLTRRGKAWILHQFESGQWQVDSCEDGWIGTGHYADPFTALVEADKWMTEQEKGRRL